MAQKIPPEQRNRSQSLRLFTDYLMDGEDVIDEVVAPDFRGHGFGGHDGELVGPAGLRDYFGETVGTLWYDIHDQVATDDTVVTRWTVRTPSDIVRGGPSPTGGETEMSGITIDRFEAGKLKETWVQADYLHLYRQLGLVAEPEL
ncbi:ester cyclase [Haladaptatus sp. DJG-WS-42]|uniref:ester cyclase n=1 Tax=Haladaptatus sp. DJG-WS-42 TaxID=3120516 RepID=UPI0030CAD8C2